MIRTPVASNAFCFLCLRFQATQRFGQERLSMIALIRGLVCVIVSFFGSWVLAAWLGLEWMEGWVDARSEELVVEIVSRSESM